MNISWWMWSWCVVLVNLLVSQLTDSPWLALLIGLLEIILTTIVSAKATPHKFKANNLLLIFGTFFAGAVLMIPFGCFGLTVPLINTITLPENLLRVLYLRRLLIVPWLLVAYVVVVWLWTHYLNPSLRDYFGNDKLHDFPFKTALLTALIVVIAFLIGDRGPDHLLATLYLFGGTLLISFWGAWALQRLTSLPLHRYSTKTPVILMVIALMLGGSVMYNANKQAIAASHYPLPVIISHRGVDDHNGVQNTTQSLERTAKEHPAIVETDVQESRDHQFVVMHDRNLKHLAHQKWRVEQRTEKQLLATTVSEYHHSTKISSFDHYLSIANKDNVPLIVEIKPQNISPQDVSEHFISLYRTTQLKNKFMVHSVDPQIIRKVEKLDNHVKTGVIQPFTISRPSVDKLTFYSLDYHFVNKMQIDRLHRNGLKVYAWTVNSPLVVQRMKQLKINGIITNNYCNIRDIISMNDYPLTSGIKNLLFQLV